MITDQIRQESCDATIEVALHYRFGRKITIYRVLPKQALKTRTDEKSCIPNLFFKKELPLAADFFRQNSPNACPKVLKPLFLWSFQKHFFLLELAVEKAYISKFLFLCYSYRGLKGFLNVSF